MCQSKYFAQHQFPTKQQKFAVHKRIVCRAGHTTVREVRKRQIWICKSLVATLVEAQFWYARTSKFFVRGCCCCVFCVLARQTSYYNLREYKIAREEGVHKRRSKGKKGVSLPWSAILVVRTLIMGRLDLGLEELHSLQTIAGRAKGHCLFVSNPTYKEDEECERWGGFASTEATLRKFE